MANQEKLAYGLVLTRLPESLMISGNTFNWRQALKDLGGTWNSDQKVWSLPLNADLSAFIPPKPVARIKVAPTTQYLRSDRIWVCVKKQARLDPRNPQGPLIWTCECCGTFKSSYDGT